jgi:hypothetical protein
MRSIGLPATTRADQSKAEKIRHDARRFVDALATRLRELETMARLAKHYDVFNTNEYAQFKQLFLHFSELCEEFQLLSHLTEDSLFNFERAAEKDWTEHRALEEYFRRLQIPMLHAVIRTNLRLLKVWDDRFRQGQGLPYGAREVFRETVRVIHNARNELMRPRYIALLDETALQDADRADRLLRTLIQQAPRLFDFAVHAIPPDLLDTYDDAGDSVHQPPPSPPLPLTPLA